VNKGVQKVDYWFAKAIHSVKKLRKWNMVRCSKSISFSKSPD